MRQSKGSCGRIRFAVLNRVGDGESSQKGRSSEGGWFSALVCFLFVQRPAFSVAGRWQQGSLNEECCLGGPKMLDDGWWRWMVLTKMVDGDEGGRNIQCGNLEVSN